MSISPRIVKGGLVEVDIETSQVLNVISFQYNPDTLTRSLQIQAAESEGGDRSNALRLRGPAVETISFDAEIDATDRLADPGSNPNAVEFGIHPQLAALEGLVQPPTDRLIQNDQLAASGVLEILPLQEPMTLFVWGKQRIVPVRVTDLSITEEAFDVALNPIRAKVSVSLRVLSVEDLGFDHPGGNVFMAHLGNRETLASNVASTALSSLGIDGIPV